MCRNIVKFRLALLATIISLGFAVIESKAATFVNGTIAENTNWILGNSPYVVTSSVTVNSGVTLTIEAGVVVKFSATTCLDVNGTLNAVGTSDDRIYFTDYRDDTAGGNTDGDNGNPVAGSWWGINVLEGGSATLNYTTVRYGVGTYYGGNPYYAYRNVGSVYKTGTGSLTLQNSTVSNAAYNGVWIVNSTGTHTISNNTITDNGTYGVRLENTGSTVTLSGNTISGNTSGSMYVTSNSSGVAVATDNTISGTIRIEGGSIAGDTTWSRNQIYQPLAAITVPANVTLTIQPGAKVKFSESALLDINGTLNAVGESDNRIYFTDYRDDTTGGNTDGDNGNPVAGSWWGINVLEGGSATLNYTTVRYGVGTYYGGNPYYAYRNVGSVYKTGTGSLTLQNSTVSNAAYNGVWIVNSTGTHTISNNTITDNGTYGVRLENTGSTVTLSGNTISGNTSGSMYVTSNSSGVAVATDNTISGTIRIEGGSIAGDTTWSRNQIYQPLAAITVPANVTLTIQPGAKVKFSESALLDINGTLNAVGESDNRIYFTDYRDDTTGGNTDGDNGNPVAGSWWGINVLEGGSATLNYTTVRYGVGAYYGGNPYYAYRNVGSVYKTGTGSLTLQNSTVSNAAYNGVWIVNSTGTHTISNNTISNNDTGIQITGSAAGSIAISGNAIRNNTANGIYLSNSSPTIFRNAIFGNPSGITCSGGSNPVIGGSEANGNDIYSNTNFGVFNETPTVTVNASYNWWGSVTGPAHLSNLQGTGNAVSDGVDFSNFLSYWATYFQTLTLDLTGTGTGSVMVSALSLTCNTDCTAQAHKGQALTLQAQPAVDSVFDGWTGGGCGGAGNCTFTMDNDTTINAAFRGVSPTADFSGAPRSGMEPVIVSFTDLSGHGPYSWLWNFGDGSDSSAKNPVHAYLNPGTFTVSLTAINGNGPDTETKEGYITVSACPNGPASILPNFYSSLQEAYNNSSNNSVIRARYKVLATPIYINQNCTVYLYGGYNCDHQDQLGATTIGTLTVSKGTAVLRDIVIK